MWNLKPWISKDFPFKTSDEIEEVIADIRDIKPTVINSVSFPCPDCGKERSPYNVLCMDCIEAQAVKKPLQEPALKCTCKDCLSGETALQRQLDHKFYKDAEAFRNEIKMETLKKAAVKYPEPFNPAAWSITELTKHAMAENYDQQNYIYGMYERLTEYERIIAELERLNNKKNTEIEGLMQEKEQLTKERDYWKGAFNGYSGI